jgi:6-phospho-beta-glucosidase
LKIAVIGGGSTYMPELADGLVRRGDVLPVDELWLMDIDDERLNVVGGFAQRMAEAAGSPFAVCLTTNRAEAIRGAAFVVTQIRVGGMTARRADEHLGKRHGLVGQETTGVGGMAKALRTIPVMIEIAQDVANLAPDAFLINFANPSGLITEALLRHSGVRTIGLCNIPWTTRIKIAEWLKVPPGEVELDYVGLNHLSWIRGVHWQDQDLTDRMVTTYAEELAQDDKTAATAQIARSQKAWLNYYLRYYYHTAEVIKEQQTAKTTRAEEVIDIEKELLTLYGKTSLSEKPAALEKRGGAYYSEAAAALIADLYNDAGTTHVVNTRNQGAIPNLPEDVVVEIPCHVSRAGVFPIPTAPLGPAMWGLVCAVKAYELLTVQAATHGDREAARLALLAHPLGPDGDHVDSVLDDLLETNRPHLPLFFPEGNQCCC